MAHFSRMARLIPSRCTDPSFASSCTRKCQEVAVRWQPSFVSLVDPRSFASLRLRDGARRPHLSRASASSKRSSQSLSLPVKGESFCTTKETTPGRRRRKQKQFIPVRAAVELSERARTLFSKLLASPPRGDVVGVRLNYKQSQTGEPRMVFAFDFVTRAELDADDEPVSLEVVPVVDKSDGQTRWVPKPPRDSWNDGLPKLYVSRDAFLKVLGATVDVDTNSMTPILHDKEGNRIDPNA